jgi:hypothetical protein
MENGKRHITWTPTSLSVQAGSGCHPASYLFGNGVLIPGGGVKRPWREAHHLPPTSTEVKKRGSNNYFPYVLMAQCLIS